MKIRKWTENWKVELNVYTFIWLQNCFQHNYSIEDHKIILNYRPKINRLRLSLIHWTKLSMRRIKSRFSLKFTCNLMVTPTHFSSKQIDRLFFLLFFHFVCWGFRKLFWVTLRLLCIINILPFVREITGNWCFD